MRNHQFRIRRKWATILASTVICSVASFGGPPSSAGAPDLRTSGAGADAFSVTSVADAELAQFYAPIHFQDTNPAREGPEGDFLTAFDYDGNYVGTDNWDNFCLEDFTGCTVYPFPFNAYVYYSVVETCTHWFVL